MNNQKTQSVSVTEGLSINAIFNLATFACLALAPLLYAIEIMSGAPKASEITERRIAMFLTQANLGTNDATASVNESGAPKLETATFALG